MILRKPYAFLIKHFKLIHLILSFLIIYIGIRTYQLYNFAKYYIDEGWVERLNFKASTYVDFFVYFVIIIIIFISLIILFLMKRKEKPIKFYIVMIVFNLILLILFIFSNSMLIEMEIKNMDTRSVNIMVDMNIISFYFQLVLLIFTSVRALGFNFKKFNFEDDIDQLTIESKDREEVEVNLELDTEDFITLLRKKRREFKYFYKENKYYIIIFSTFILFIIGLLMYLNIYVYNKIYIQKEVFKMGNFNTTITDSYITKRNYRNNIITKDNESYFILKMRIKNISNYSSSFDYNNYKLLSGAAIYDPTIKEYDNFIDFGVGYENNIIKPNETKEYILIYLIDDRSLKNDLIIRYRNNIIYKKDELNVKYIKILTQYKKIDKAKTNTFNLALKEEIIFDKSLLKNTKLLINNFEIKNEFILSYDYCIKDICKTYQEIVKNKSDSNYLKTILAIDMSLLLDKNIFQLNEFEFIKKYGILKYKVNDVIKEHKVELINQTPLNYKGKIIYIEVLKEIENASEISIIFKIRDNEYIYKLK